MKLSEARRAVVNEIETNRDGSTTVLISLVKLWWREFKRWEREETVARTFYDSRMSIRTYNPAGNSSKWDMVRTSVMATKVGEKNTTNFTGKYDVSGTGVKERTIPKNFYQGVKSKSLKYELGLHDLSASLLDPAQRISAQLYHALNRVDKDGALAVFMPLPEPEDVSLFDILNSVVKKFPNSPLNPLIREYRSKMTRIKQAYEYDLGANFSASDRPQGTDKTGPKFKYGVGAKLKTKDQGLRTTQAEDVERITLNAFRYRDILRSQPNKGKYNEIVISYREHGSPIFPLFGRWNFKNLWFDIFDINTGRDMRQAVMDMPRR